MPGPMFAGSLTALLTPFKDGHLDEPALQKFVQWQIDQGTKGVIPCGTTGESPTLSHEEDMRVTSLTVEVAAGKVPVIAGTGSNSTEEAISLSRHAKEAGADAILVVAPYYNKPTQEGLYQHFKAIHDAVDLPLVLYNIPGRSIVDISVATMARLAALPNIVGVKDATGDLKRPAETRLAIGPDFCQLTGEDPMVMPFLGAGGHGCISVTSNVAPKLCAELHEAWGKGDLETARQINDRLYPLHHALFAESSPGPVKYAASLLGLCQNELRLPLVTIEPKTEKLVYSAMVHAGLIN